jgi:hypothetical protein
LLDGREGLENDKIEDNEDDIEIANGENFFLINYADRGAISPYFAKFVIDITITEIASTY